MQSAYPERVASTHSSLFEPEIIRQRYKWGLRLHSHTPNGNSIRDGRALGSKNAIHLQSSATYGLMVLIR